MFEAGNTTIETDDQIAIVGIDIDHRAVFAGRHDDTAV